MEDSISCSPGNDKKHSRTQRLRKKMKRKKQLLDQPIENSTYQLEEDIPILQAMYDDSRNSIACSVDFNPFENAIILAAADTAAPPRKRIDLTPRGFVKLEDLPLIESENEEPKQDAVGPETQFGITESEFMRFCEEVEIADPEPAVNNESPQVKAKSIVDAILQDFCGSPYEESPPRIVCDDATPIFRFKSKPLRTYSRRSKKKPLRRNIGSELANVHLWEDESNGSVSSGLSVQEDLSQNVVPQLDTVDLNNSTKVCENLLNLSLYFSQENKSPVAKRERSLTFIVEDIIRLKQKSVAISSAVSDDEFYGFTDDSEDSSHEDTLKDLLEDEDELLQQINCDSHCYDEAAPKVESEHQPSVDIESILETVDAVIERANRLITSICDVTIKDEPGMSNDEADCDKLISQDSMLTDEQLAADVDLWNDNDLLLDYMTQDPAINGPNGKVSQDSATESVNFHNPRGIEKHLNANMPETCGTPPNIVVTNVMGSELGAIPPPKDELRDIRHEEDPPVFVGFSTASKKPIAISVEAQLRANRLLAEFEQEARKMEDTTSMTSSHKQSEEESAGYIGFSTASKKPIVISEDAKSRATKLLEQFEQGDDVEEFKVPQPSSSLAGFSTASRKPIAISEASKRKADAILNDFVEEETHLAQNFGFSTASRKPIAISVEAQRRADTLLKQFEQSDQGLFNVPKKSDAEQEVQEMLMGVEFLTEAFDEEISANNQTQACLPPVPSSPIFEGFKTASKKPIQISDSAKQRAEQILKTVENTAVPEEFLKCIEDDLNHVPETVVQHTHVTPKNAGTHQEVDENDSTSLKRKRNLFSLDNSQETPKMMSPRRLSCDERTPLNPIGNTTLRKTPSLPLFKSSTKTSFLSRRNLLSLNKRKKYTSPEKTSNPCPTAPKTPENSNHFSSPHNHANATPNLKEFFDSVSTSTPRLIRNNQTKPDAGISNDSIDPDFRKINWEETNNTNSVRVCSTKSITDLNVIGMDVSPSPKQRIERLKMYGEPPAISPILMINKCRPSGLRRGRSLMKS